MQLVRSGTTGIGLLWLLLATIFAHALLPIGSPLVRTTGSAFSATTAEVSLAPSRKGKASVANEQTGTQPDDLGSSDEGDTDVFVGQATHRFSPTETGGRADIFRSSPELLGFARRPFQARAPPLR